MTKPELEESQYISQVARTDKISEKSINKNQIDQIENNISSQL